MLATSTAEPWAQDATALAQEAGAIRRQIEEARALAEAAAALRDAELEASVLRRHLERQVAAERHRLDRERRRAAGGLYAGERRSPGQTSRVAVHPKAWETLKGEALRRRSSVGYLVGALVTGAVRHNKLLPDLAGERCATQRFARLLLVDADTWLAFRSLALDARVTTTRAVGALVEVEAVRLGWKPEVER